jgi:hypothetical protein
MGQLIDFYAGDPDQIGTAFTARDFKTLRDRDRIPLAVDFSLHVTSLDFDFLTQEARAIVGEGPESMTASLERHVGGDGSESSADVLSPKWVQLLAAVPSDREPALATAWARALAAEYSDAIGVTPELTDALGALR